MFNINSSNRSFPNGNVLPDGTSNRTLHSRVSTTYASFNGSSSLMHSDITEQHSNQRKVPAEILEALLASFRKNTCSLNSPMYKINQPEFAKVISALQSYKSTFAVSSSLMWLLEKGESSTSTQDIKSESQSSYQLVCFVVSSESQQVLGKLVIQDPEKKFIISKSSHLSLYDGNTTHRLTNLVLLKNMSTLTSAGVRDQFIVPTQHKKLADLITPIAIATRHQVFGVVTAISKIPTAPVPPKKYWHSIIWITDPSLISETDESVASFKMNVFMISGEDFPEVHRGDVIRFTNVKVELEFKHYDGRIFKKDELTVYCYWDFHSPVPREDNEERASVVRVLSKWWSLNSQHFDCLTPRPIYHTFSKYPGVRCLREISNHLVFDIYCQVTGVSDNLNGLKLLYVRDGTIFTTLDEKSCASSNHTLREDQTRHADELLKPSYGYLALVVFDINHWKRIESLKIVVGDYLLLKGVRVVFCEKENFTTLGSTYPFQYPCVLLRPAPYHDSEPKKIIRIRANHHEAAKIRSRLHRLPDALEEMKLWKPLPAAEGEEPVDMLLADLMNPVVQLQLLSNLKR